MSVGVGLAKCQASPGGISSSRTPAGSLVLPGRDQPWSYKVWDGSLKLWFKMHLISEGSPVPGQEKPNEETPGLSLLPPAVLMLPGVLHSRSHRPH